MKRHLILASIAAIATMTTASAAYGNPMKAALRQDDPSSQQPGTARLSGVVLDGTGAAIPGAIVTVHTAQGDKNTTSDAEGNYSIPGLPSGRASVTVSFQGFKNFQNATVVLQSGKTETVDARMATADSTETVTVTASRSTAIETENAEITSTIPQKEIVSLGLNGRNFSSLLTLAPGVSNQTGQDEAKVGVVGSAKFSVNGGRTEYNTFTVDGNDVLNADIAASHGHSTLLVYPSVDAIQELKVLTSNYGAQYGRSASGTVQVAIKGGGDSFHGNAYEFLRNEYFNARNYFDEPGKAPLYRRNDFGFTFGGPLTIPHLYQTGNPRNHFFVSEEWRKEKTPFEFNQGVPTDSERGYNLATHSYGSIADFSDVCPTSAGANISFSQARYPDCPGLGYGGNKSTYPSNQFYIDPVAQVIQQSGLIPRANANSGCNSSIGSCYVGSVSPSTDYRQDLGRFDRQITDGTKLYITIVHDHWMTQTAIPWWTRNPNSFPSVENSFLGPGYSGIAHVTSLITPTFLNDFSVSATWQRISLEDTPGPGVNLDRSPLDNVPDPMGSFFDNCFGGTSTGSGCAGGKLPGIQITGTNSEFGGNGFTVDTSYMPWFSSRGQGTISDSVSKYVGKHAIQAGVQWVFTRRHEYSGQNGANSGDTQGLLTFRNVSSFNTTGNAFADFLYNNYNPSYRPLSGESIYSYTQDSGQETYRVQYTTVEPFVQDDIKVTPHLTVNLGIRLSLFGNWEPQSSQTVYNWQLSDFDPTLTGQEGISINPLRGYLQNASGQPVPRDLTNLDPALTNGLVQCGVGRIPKSCQSSHLFNPAPRVGFAWDPIGKGTTSVRGGYGVFFEHGTGSEANVGSLMSNPPQVLSMTQEYPDNYQNIGSVGVPGSSNYTQVETPLNVVSIPSKTVWPYVQQWSFGAEHELDSTNAFNLAYVGSRGTHLAVAEQLNQLPPVPSFANPFGPHEPLTQDFCLANQINSNNLQDPNAYFVFPNQQLYYGQNAGGQPYNPATFLSLVAACDGTQGANGHPSIAYGLNYLRPYQGVGEVQAIRNEASSSYHSMQFTWRHTHAPVADSGFSSAMWSPTDFSLAYTYSHSIDSASDRFESNFIDSYDLAANKASSDFDQRHLLNISYIYDLPLMSVSKAFWNSLHWKVLEPTKANPSDEPTSAKIGYPEYGEPSAITRTIFSNWQLSGITLLQTGTPFSVINGGGGIYSALDNAGLALGESADSYPDKVPADLQSCSPPTSTVDTEGPLLRNPCGFVAPRGLTQGSAGRNSLNNPGRMNWDMALLRNFDTPGEHNLQFRAEAFNVFNQTQFIIYDPIRGNTASNTVSCYGGPSSNYSAGDPSCSVGNGFLHPVSAHRPRTIQFGMKYDF